MLKSLDAGVSALNQFQQELNIIGNNIANVSTTGYKSATLTFADAFSQSLGSNSAGSIQVGNGVLTGSISNNFTQGSLSNTGVQTNMAINGSGFFSVVDPSTGNAYATRDGSFSVDTSGYLITSTGARVQGYSDAALTSQGPIKIDNTGAPGNDTSAVQSYTFGADGKLTVLLNDGVQFVRGQVLLQNYSNPQQLVKAGNNLFSNLTNAGPLTTPLAPGASGLGTVVTGELEQSNVDLAGQLTSLITTQRAYEANGKVITTSDDVLQTLINLKR